MDLSFLIPDEKDTVSERYQKLQKIEVLCHPYEGNISRSVVDIVEDIRKGYAQDNFSYMIDEYHFRGGGVEKVLGCMYKSKHCDLYYMAVDHSQKIGIPVIESLDELEQKLNHYLSEESDDIDPDNKEAKEQEKLECYLGGIIPFNTELHLIEGDSEDFRKNGESSAFYFVLPNRKYLEQDLIKSAINLIE